VRDQFPVLHDVPLQLYRGGLPTMTADGRHIVGPVPGAEGFYALTGCVVGGLSIAPGLGENLAQLILTGRSDIPLDLFAGKFIEVVSGKHNCAFIVRLSGHCLCDHLNFPLDEVGGKA